MHISLNLGRWGRLRTVAAFAMALVLAGVVGRALAVGPTVDAPIRWAGGVSSLNTNATMGSASTLYTVPAGVNFMLTDLIVSNPNATNTGFNLYSSAAGSCSAIFQFKLADVFIPAHSTVVVPLVTGFGFAAGQRACIASTGTTVFVNARGYHFTAAPAS